MLGMVTGCSTLPRNPVPLDKMYRAEIPGLTGVRAWSGTFSKEYEADLLLSAQQAVQHARSHGAGSIATTNVLSISGGGDYGAFGAGIMYGWSQSGSRPEFNLVTGISAGALIAPFAFLGPGYDNELKRAFTTVSARDIYVTRWLSFLWSDAFADTTPLALLIKRFYTQDILQATAKAYGQGRRLYIGTTNLDADRLIIWNMGAIAASGHPRALELFQQVILASSSIPGAFPPVFFEVEIDGVSYDEMHVDGGVKAQLFLLAATLDVEAFRRKLGAIASMDRDVRIFVIRNAEIAPEPKQVPRKLDKISARAISSLLKTQARNDISRIYEIARQHGLEFNWIALPAEYEPSGREKFDTEEMNRLFKLGYELGLKENAWRQDPPGIDQP
jgi:predicted acylesterase/phospholipase RssA